jgi:hypothetical protein
MSAATKRKAPKEFDENKLQSLTEPISIHVTRQTGGRQQPIDLPIKPNEQYPGQGWSADDVRQLPQFLATAWTGGGLYSCKATGANGETMDWEFFFPPNQIPERQPPTMAPPQQPGPAPGMAGVVSLPFAAQQQPAGSWLGQAAQYYQPPANQQVPMSYLQGGFPGFNPYLPPNGYGQVPYGGGLTGGTFLGTRLGGDDKYQAEREARIQLEGKMERQQADSAHQQQIAALTAEVRRTQEQLAKRPGDDESPALRAALSQIEALRHSQEQNQVAQQIAAVQASTQQMLTEMRSATAQQIAALSAAITAAPKGPDPIIMLLLESTKAQAAAQTAAAEAQSRAQIEVARMQAESARETARNAFGPTHVVDLMMRAQSGTEHLSTAYRGALDMVTTAAETMMNMQQPSMHPALEMVGQAAQGGLGILQQYVAGNAQTKQAEAQAQGMAAQAAAMAQAQAQRAAGQHALAGAQPGTPVVIAAGQPTVIAAGKRDEAAFFGPAWGSVQQFRQAVSTGNVDPTKAAAGIVQAINYFAHAGTAADVRAFDLWKRGELAELVDALLPGAPTSYREQTTQLLFQLLQQLRAQQGGQRATATKN